MNKSQLVDAISSDTGLSKTDSKKALESVLENIKKALKSNDRVSLVGFGSFSVSKRNSRIGRNPQSGQELQIPAKNIVKFKPGTELTDAVN